MPKVVGYHRPASVEEALSLLAQPSAAALAGGTQVNATPFGTPIIAVDLQSLGLSGIQPDGAGALRIGATTTLQTIADDARVPELLRTLARREAPSTLRTLATIGGTIAAGGWESELLTGLLACQTVVNVRSTEGSRTVDLESILADGELLQGSLITEVVVRIDGTFAADHTGRTPGDTAIVGAVARRTPTGQVLVALSGVAATPILVTDPTGLTPPGDFRGSSEYRLHLAVVLTARVTKAVSA